jgi:hypothetical protein
MKTLSAQQFGRAWRVTYDGEPLGDDRGFDTEVLALAEARRRVGQDIYQALLGGERGYTMAALHFTLDLTEAGQIAGHINGTPVTGEDLAPLFARLQELEREQYQRKLDAEIAELQASVTAAQRETIFHGVHFIVQKHTDHGWEIAAWPKGYTRDTAPFVIEIGGFGNARPWVIGIEKRGEHGSRRELLDKTGRPFRFGSIEAAARKALDVTGFTPEAKAV